MLVNAWKGYNCTLFAYGQTGSGKSYTIMGYEANIGLVPRICSELFRQVNSRTEPGVSCEVTFSMLEIYNEEVRDLLSSKKSKEKPSLKVREGKNGFYADGLIERPVADYQALNSSLAEGDRSRSLAATKMNETSSRAHTMVTIKLRQNFPSNVTKLAALNLVDLAGSERQKQTGSEGDRFKESTKINQSLSTLGSVLEALVKNQQGTGKWHVPFRDSKLTLLLKNALGGNSRTTMVATISPAAENYEQSLSTLKYADRTKKIRNNARVNEMATDKLVQQLLSEKEALLRELELSRSRGTSTLNAEELAKAKAEHEEEIERYKQEMQDIRKSWSERLQSEQQKQQERIDELEKEEKRKERVPYLWNLNEDLSLCAKIIHFLPEGEVSTIGNQRADPLADITLSGPGYYQKHAAAKYTDGKMSITPIQGKVFVNGREISEKKSLHHNDRVCFEGKAIFVVADPRKVAKYKKEGKSMKAISYEFARSELDKRIVESIEGDENLKHEVLTIIPLVRDANAISSELFKHCKFEQLLVSALSRGLLEGRTEVYIKMTNEQTGNSYLWKTDQFTKRHGIMMDLYIKYQEQGVAALDVLDELDDPFYEPPETECLVGVVVVPLVSLSIMTDYQDSLLLMNYDAEAVGHLEVELVPCDASGDEDVDYGFIEPSDLTWCKFKFFDFHQTYQTDQVSGINPRYAFSKKISIKDAGHEFEHYVSNMDMCIEIWGYQDVQRDSSKSMSPSEALRRKNWQLQAYQAENSLYKDYLGDITQILEEGEFCSDCNRGPLKAIRKKLDDLETELYLASADESNS
ncbi:kinesin-like protein KIF28P [Watersipora subatra]|uniref:kinesin-like protein KIF28P n=1 Tax=Watersipora subatra TaxID=2589382 RepID=UPI00355B6CFD